MGSAVRLASFRRDFKKIYTFYKENLASRGVVDCGVDWITTNKDSGARIFTIKAKGLMYFVSVTYIGNKLSLHFGEGAKYFIYGGSLFKRCCDVELLWGELSGEKVELKPTSETIYYGRSSGYGLEDSDKVAFYACDMERVLRKTLAPYGEVGESIVKKALATNWDIYGWIGLKLNEQRIFNIEKTKLEYIQTMHTELQISC